jgi:Holliday junction resolvasome RuvABC endonuclease subunit
MRILRLKRHLTELTKMRERHTVIAYEEVRQHKGTDAAHIYGAIVGAIQEFCEALQIPYVGAPVGTLKKLATGRGNAPKDLVLTAAQMAWPKLNIESHDAADACWIAQCLMEGRV